MYDMALTSVEAAECGLQGLQGVDAVAGVHVGGVSALEGVAPR